MSKKLAFTLAEVLITLTVIGVVAALSIPTLLSSSNSTADVTKLKKTYATLSNAVKLYEAENGSLKTAFAGNDSSAASDLAAFNALTPYLNIIKNCGSSKGCWYDSPLKYLGGSNYVDKYDTTFDNAYGKAILSDGTMILIDDHNGACSADKGDGPLKNTCGNLIVDINGAKGPNQIGRDYFLFHITSSGIYPMGSYNDNLSCETDSTALDTTNGCAAKVLAEGEINY